MASYCLTSSSSFVRMIILTPLLNGYDKNLILKFCRMVALSIYLCIFYVGSRKAPERKYVFWSRPQKVPLEIAWALIHPSPPGGASNMMLIKHRISDQAYLSTDQCGVYHQSSSEKGTLSLLLQRNWWIVSFVGISMATALSLLLAVPRPMWQCNWIITWVFSLRV